MKIKIDKHFLGTIKKFHSTKYKKEGSNQNFKYVFKINSITILEALKKTIGINTSTALYICSTMGISPSCKVKNLMK